RLAARERNRSTDGSAGSRCTRAAPVRSLKCSSSRAISNRRGWPASTTTIASDEEPSAKERDADKSRSAAAASLAVRRNRSLRKKNKINVTKDTRTHVERKSKPGAVRTQNRELMFSQRAPAKPEYLFTVRFTSCGGGHLGCRRGRQLAARTRGVKSKCLLEPHADSAGQDARLYGRQDACRYAKHVKAGGLKS